MGAREAVPDIPGVDQDWVTMARNFYLDKQLQRKGRGRSVIIGAGSVGCEIAWYLAFLGRTVYLADILPYDGWLSSEHPTNRFILLEQLSENGVYILDAAQNLEIDTHDNTVSLTRNEVFYKIHTDDVIIATGYKKSDRFFSHLKNKLQRGSVYAIGDWAEPRDIHWAIREGYEIGNSI